MMFWFAQMRPYIEQKPVIKIDYIDKIHNSKFEELNIEIDVKSFFMRNNHSYPKFTVELISYISLFYNGEIKLVDHDKYEWVEINQLKDYNFLDGDIPIIDNIINKNINPSS